MDTFFSIIYLTINASLKEKISIGLIMANGNDIKFKISDTKLGIVKQLIPTQNYSFLKAYFKSLDDSLNINFVDNLQSIKNEMSNNWVNEKYFSYLNKYSNNVVNFSTAREIDIEFSESAFLQLYKKYIFSIDELPSVRKATKDIITSVREQLYSKLETKVDLDATVNPSHFKELISPVNINFIGENGKVVSGQTIDFSKRYVDLERDLTKYISFTKAVDFEKGDGHYFLVGDEPSNIQNNKNHTIWRHIYESKIVDYVPLKETERILDYINTNNVRPYFELSE